MATKLTKAEFDVIERETKNRIERILRDLMDACGYDQDDPEGFRNGLVADLAMTLKQKSTDLLSLMAALLVCHPMTHKYEEPEKESPDA